MRALRLREGDREGRAPRPLYDLVPRIQTVVGRPAMVDAPSPHVEGLFDHDLVWVSVDPVDALLLQSLGFHAVSLATPTITLGDENGIRQLEAIGALSTQRDRRGTIVVVDPGEIPTEGWGGLLNGLFEKVWHVSAAPQVGAELTVTGYQLAEVVRSSRPYGFDQQREASAILFGRLETVGSEYKVEPVRLHPVSEPAEEAPPADIAITPYDETPFTRELGNAAATHVNFDGAYPPQAFSTLPGDRWRTDRSTDFHGETLFGPPFGPEHTLEPYTPARAHRDPSPFFKVGDEGGTVEINWLVDSFIPEGAITEFQGPGSVGKTTLLSSLISAVSNGGYFLGSRCSKTPVIYVSEKGRLTTEPQLARSAGPLHNVTLLTEDKHRNWDLNRIVAEVNDHVKSTGPSLVVFDTIFKTGKDIRRSLRSRLIVDKILDQIQRLLDSGCTVVVVRHGKDEEGLPGGTGSGAPELSERAVSKMQLRTSGTSKQGRVLTVWAPTKEEFSVELELADGSFEPIVYDGGNVPPSVRATAPPSAFKLNETDAHVLEAVDAAEPPGASVQEILDALKARLENSATEAQVRSSLKRLVKSGVLRRTNKLKGKKGNPDRFARI